MNEFPQKFSHPQVTAKGTTRASVPFQELKTLWFNTGTLCNLACANCYIESSPRNDRLSFISAADVIPYLDEIRQNNLKTQHIGYTGGEPFINPDFMSILQETLKRGFNVLVLTNACKVLTSAKKKVLLELKNFYPKQLSLRVSMDHYTHEIHDRERGKNALAATLETFKWLYEHNFELSIAGRSLADETLVEAKIGHEKLLKKNQIDLPLSNNNLIIFPEMNDGREVPEISIGCWEILGKTPQQLMCSTERMVVKHRAKNETAVQACTLLAYDDEFNLGKGLIEASKKVYLNHEFCAKFCVLGGASCSG